MHKKALVVAVAAAFGAPGAYAQTKDPKPSWEFYGKFYPELLQIKGSGPTAAGTPVATIAAAPTGTERIVSRVEMQPSNSRVGFRGNKNLGRGLQGIWQLETEVAIDEGESTLATRDTFVGLQTGMGTVRLGNMDTPFKNYGDTLGFLGVSSGNFVSTSNVLRKSGSGSSSSSSFHLRRANSVMYDSPEAGGFQGAVSYSLGDPGEGTITGTRKPKVISVGVKYESGPLYLAVMHELHDDLFGGSNNALAAQSNAADQSVRSKDRANQFTVQYKWGIHAFEADFIAKEYKEDATTAGRFKQYKNNAWMLVMENRWSSQWRTAFHYVKADEGSCQLVGLPCNTSGLDGTQISAGASYYLDRDLYLFGLYSVVKNGHSARYENADLQRGNPGEDITHVAVGISYSF